MPNTNSTANQVPPNIDINTPYTPRRPAPLVSISVNHPFATAFRKIKNFLVHKQTLFSTSFTIKVTPIVAIVSLFGVATLFGGGITTAFTFGKTVEQKFLSSLPTPMPKIIVTTPIPAPVIVSRSGTIKATYQLPSGSDQKFLVTTPIPPDQTGSVSAETTPTPSLLHYILVSRGGSTAYLMTSSTVRLQNYLNLRVLITGSFDSTKNTLTITKPEDIEVLQ